MPYKLNALTLVLLLSAPCLLGQQAAVPKLEGYVSGLESQTSFEIDGRRVEGAEKTASTCPDLHDHPSNFGSAALTLGDYLVVYGKYDKKHREVHASAVCKYGLASEKVSGAAVLEKIEGQRLLVDGRLLVADSKSVVKAEGERHSLADARVNDWVRYSAAAQRDGSYLVREITVAPNMVSPQGARLSGAKFLEFIAPDTAAKRDGSIRFGHLSRRYKLPAGEQVGRLARLGTTVIPPYQRALAADDAVRIDFHFYPIDGLKMSSCLSTPSGNVFVPSALLKRMPEDGDLAAILATCVADLIEKQPEILLPKAEGNTGVLAAGVTAGLFVPGLGLAALVGTSIYGAHVQEQLQHQSARVSLDLLEAGGYAPSLAPHAQQLAEAKRLPLKLEGQPSDRTAYLYEALAQRERAAGAQTTGQVEPAGSRVGEALVLPGR